MNGRSVLETKAKPKLIGLMPGDKPIKRTLVYSDQSIAPDLKDAIGSHYPEVPRRDIRETGTWRFKRGYDTAVIDTRNKSVYFEYPTVNHDLNEETIKALLELFEGKVMEVES